MNIVVLRYGGIGDILLATPLLRSLGTKFADAKITFVTEAGNMGVLKDSTLLSFTVGLDSATRASLMGSLTRGNALRKELGNVDLYVNLQPSMKSTSFGFGLMPKRTWTFKKERSVQQATGKVRHAIDDFLNVFPSGIPTNVDRNMEFVISDEAKQAACEKVRAIDIDLRNTILINPAGTREINRWPPKYIAQLMEWIEANMPYYSPVLVGGPGDVWLEKQICNELGHSCKSLVGKLSLQELGAVMRDAAVTITGDTGPLHIAVAVGARIVCLSGAADPDRTGPSNNPKDLVVINRTLPCVPCQGRTCKRGDIACMTQLTVDSVVQALESRIKAG